jgi:hypothetical protein
MTRKLRQYKEQRYLKNEKLVETTNKIDYNDNI